MPTEKELTGYPSIDKPWLKYYTEEAINAKLPECTIYEYLYENNKDHTDDIAIVYFGKRITYGELFKNIDKVAASFHQLGVKKNDAISIIGITTPEIIYSFYALNKLGAVANMIDPRMSDVTIANLIRNTNSKTVVILDIFFEKIDKICETDGVINIINIKVANSMSLLYKAISTIKGRSTKKNDKLIRWTDFITKNTYDAIAGTGDSLALIEYTGGTTGDPKGVALTNKNVNAVVEQYRRTRIKFIRQNTWQSVSAPFIAYVWVISMHCPLSFGIKCQIEIYNPKTIAESIIKKPYNHVAANPLVWETLIKHPLAQKKDFSRLVVPTTGADYMSPKLEIEINDFFASHGCEYKICQGYGMTEVGSAVSVNISNTVNRLGSVGIPFVKTTISTFEVDGEKELQYGESGEICICGPSVMQGYWENPQATSEIIKKHSDGTVWLHTGDLGHIDEDGFVYIDGRLKRMIIKYNGAKVFPPIIEKTILKHNAISKCSVVGVVDKKHTIGSEPIAFVVKNFDIPTEKIIQELKEKCKQELPEYAQPVDFIFIDKMPLTPIGKVDYRALEKEAEK